MSSAISIDNAMDSATVEDYKDNDQVLDTSSADQMAADQSEDTNDISSTSTVETTTAISTPTDKTITTPPITKPSSSINKLQNVKWRREWRGIHLPPSASILNSKFYSKNDIINEIEMESESIEIEIDVEDQQHIEVPIEVLPVEVPTVEDEQIEDKPSQTSILYAQNQPSIPLYPLLITIILYHILKYIFRKLFNYKKRTRFMRSMKCRINSLGGNYEQFAISQSELTGHIEKLKSRNEKKRRNKESDNKKKKKQGKKKGKDGDKNDRGGKKDDDTDGDDRGMGDETDENENEDGNSTNNNTNGGSGSTGTTNNKSGGQQSDNKRNSYSSTNHSTNHNDQAIIQEYKVKVQQLTKQNEVLLLKVNQLEVENEQLDNEMEHMMDEMCNNAENEDSHDGKEIDISGSYSDTILESLTVDEDDEDTLLQELEDAKVDISTLTKDHQVAKEEVLRLTMEVAKLTSDKKDLEQRLKDEEVKGYQRCSSYNALRAERDILNDALVDINKSMQNALDIVAETAGDSKEQDDTSLEVEDTKTTTHEKARYSASRLLSQLYHIKANGVLLPGSPPASPPLSPISPTDQASFDRLEMGRRSRKMMETSVVSSTVSSPSAGDLCLIESSSPQRQVDPTRRKLFPSQGQAKEVVLLPRVLPPQPVVKDCAIAIAVDSQHTQDSTKGSSSSSSSGEESSARDEEWHNKPIVNTDVIDDSSLNQQSISYGMNETYCSDDEYDAYDNDLIVGFKGSILNLSKAASRDVDAIQRSRGLSKLVRIWSKRSERSKW